VPFADFVEKLDMSMTGKHWASSEWIGTREFGYCNRADVQWEAGKQPAPDPCVNADASRGIGNAEEVLGKEAANQTTPLELPW
jgi:hypothetical protein